MMKRRILLAVVAISGVALVLTAFFRHRAPDRPKSPPQALQTPASRVSEVLPPPEPAPVLDERETARRMDEGAVKGLVLDFKLAVLRDDLTTQRALLDGLKRHGSVARLVIERERADVQDPRVLAAFNAALEELP